MKIIIINSMKKLNNLNILIKEVCNNTSKNNNII